MNGFWLLLPFLAVRFGLLLIIRKSAIQRAGYFAPVQGTEKIAYYIYQVSNIGLFLYLLVTAVKIDFSLYLYLGFVCYILGIVLCAISIVCFATVYKGNIIKNLIMDCQSYKKYRPNETTGGIFVSWRRKEELPTGA